MTRTPRPLRPGDLVEAAATLEALAAELRADHATHVQQAIGAAIEAGYPATTSGAGNNSGSDPSSRPEALTIRPDRAATQAVALTALLRKLVDTAPVVLRGLRAHDPNRKIRACPRCGHVIADGMSRCNRMTDDGRRCGVCRNTDCPRGGTPLEPGEKMRDGECHTCAQRTHRARKTARPEPTGAVASIANLVDGMADIEVAD